MPGRDESSGRPPPPGQSGGADRGDGKPGDEVLARRAAELGRRIEDAKARHEPVPQRSVSPGSGYALAFRFAADLVAGAAVGGFIGWTLDRHFGTAPWLMAVFLLLGFAAGVSNIVRAAREMQDGNGTSPHTGPPGAEKRADGRDEH